jgi:hypothetical protein
MATGVRRIGATIDPNDDPL